MYRIVRRNEAKVEQIDENQHRYILPGPLSIIEAAEVVEKIVATHKQLYYIVDGVLLLDGKELTTGDYVMMDKGDSMIISGTFKVLICNLGG